jgi:hypothetical protein
MKLFHFVEPPVYNYYKIESTSKKDIRQELRRTKLERALVYTGFTRSFVRYDFTADAIFVRLTTVIDIPKFKAGSSAHYKNQLKILKCHELVHFAINQKAFEKMIGRLRKKTVFTAAVRRSRNRQVRNWYSSKASSSR